MSQQNGLRGRTDDGLGLVGTQLERIAVYNGCRAAEARGDKVIGNGLGHGVVELLVIDLLHVR